MDSNKMMNSLKKNIDKLFENQVFNTIFIIFISIFAAHFAPRLPKKILYLFNADIVKILFMAFIAYTSTKNMGIAIITAIALIILMQSLRSIQTQDKIIDKITESTQITSDNRIKLIGQIISNPNTEKEQKMSLFNNVLNSIASDKHKFNTGMLLLKSLPESSTDFKLAVIDKLYSPKSNIKPENIINMSQRLLSGRQISENHIPRVIKHLLKSPVDNETKKKIIFEVLNTSINPKIKIIIMKRIKKSNVSVNFKNEIIEKINSLI
jgi:hypothetical protein